MKKMQQLQISGVGVQLENGGVNRMLMLAARIYDALWEAYARLGTQAEMQSRTGVGQAKLNRYLNRTAKTQNMTVGTLEQLLPILDGVQVVYGSSTVSQVPEPLAELCRQWHRMPPDSQAAITALSNAMLNQHGLKGGNGPGHSIQPAAAEAG